MSRSPERVVVGLNETVKALEEGKLDKIFVTEDLDKIFVRISCGKLSRFYLVENEEHAEKIAVEVCQGIGDPSIEIVDESFIGYLLDKSSETATKVFIVPRENKEYFDQLKSGFGGIAGIARY